MDPPIVLGGEHESSSSHDTQACSVWGTKNGLQVNSWPIKNRNNSQDKGQDTKKETPDSETNEGCFIQDFTVARHPDDSIDIFPDPIYLDEEIGCRVSVQGPVFFDTTEYYEETGDSQLSGSDTKEPGNTGEAVHTKL